MANPTAKKVTIIQPAYLPWLGFFHRVAISDLFIVLDHVQMDTSSKTNFATRNRVRTPQGWTWLSVPIQRKGNYGQLNLNTITTNNDQDWRRRHIATIENSYRRARFFKDHHAFLKDVYEQEWEKLVDICHTLMVYMLDQFEIKTPVIYSSQMNVEGTKDELILNLCKEAGATGYISGPFGRTYLNHDDFHEAGIDLYFHDYTHPQYEQMFEGFEPYMSAIDLLLNMGPESLGVLHEGQAELPRE